MRKEPVLEMEQALFIYLGLMFTSIFEGVD